MFFSSAGLSAISSETGTSMKSATSARCVFAAISSVSYSSGASGTTLSMPYACAFLAMIVMARMMGT